MRSHEAELPHLHLLQVSYINKSINIACLAKEKKLRSHERKAQKQDPGCISQWVRKKCTNRCTRVCVCVCSVLSNSVTPWQEYWSGFPFPSPGDLLNPGIESTSLVYPALAGGFFIPEPPAKL